jgi:hypothetical protein
MLVNAYLSFRNTREGSEKGTMHGAAVATQWVSGRWAPRGCCERPCTYGGRPAAARDSRCCGCDIDHLFQVSGELASKGGMHLRLRGDRHGVSGWRHRAAAAGVPVRGRPRVSCEDHAAPSRRCLLDRRGMGSTPISPDWAHVTSRTGANSVSISWSWTLTCVRTIIAMHPASSSPYYTCCSLIGVHLIT